MPLGQPDVHGLQVDAPSGQAHPRLVVLDIAFPARPWVLDATHLCIGELVPDAHAHLHQPEEAMSLVRICDEILRSTDIDLLAREQEAKNLILSVSSSLRR